MDTITPVEMELQLLRRDYEGVETLCKEFKSKSEDAEKRLRRLESTLWVMASVAAVLGLSAVWTMTQLNSTRLAAKSWQTDMQQALDAGTKHALTTINSAVDNRFKDLFEHERVDRINADKTTRDAFEVIVSAANKFTESDNGANGHWQRVTRKDLPDVIKRLPK